MRSLLALVGARWSANNGSRLCKSRKGNDVNGARTKRFSSRNLLSKLCCSVFRQGKTKGIDLTEAFLLPLANKRSEDSLRVSRTGSVSFRLLKPTGQPSRIQGSGRTVRQGSETARSKTETTEILGDQSDNRRCSSAYIKEFRKRFSFVCVKKPSRKSSCLSALPWPQGFFRVPLDPRCNSCQSFHRRLTLYFPRAMLSSEMFL